MLQLFLTEPKVVSKNHKTWLTPELEKRNSQTDFYISKLFGPDADHVAYLLGFRQELKSKEGVWTVIGKKNHKKLLALGAKEFSDVELEKLIPTPLADSENSPNESE